MIESPIRSGIPGAGSRDPFEPYSLRARLGFVIGGVVVVGFPVLLGYYGSHSTLHLGKWWSFAGAWWTLVAACVLSVALAKIAYRVKPDR